jgi:MoCo/4Fe-4S cofactor protein with predicted Tat translocation signal
MSEPISEPPQPPPPTRARVSLPIVEEAREASVVATAEVRRYWRSIAEKEGSPRLRAAAAHEFPPGAAELPDVNRRSFMQLLGSSASLAAVTSCVQPLEKAIPFVRRPVEVTPGISLHFATAHVSEGYASGLLVESYEGRPTKIEGNPEHYDNRGTARAFEQALLLGLYDNDRAKQLKYRGDPISWMSFLGQMDTLAVKHATNGGAGLRFLGEPTSSPFLIELRQKIAQRFPKAKFVSYSPIASEGAAAGMQLAYGRAVEPRHTLSRTSVIVALDSDFLGQGPEQLRLSREFAQRRAPGPDMNRLYVVEPCLSITGMSADHRLRAKAGDVVAHALALAAELSLQPGFSSLTAILGAHQSPSAVDPSWVKAVAADLNRNRGRSLLIAGRRQPAEVHALVAVLNSLLDNVGASVVYGAPLLADASCGTRALGVLAQEIAAGEVDTLVITANNPAYSAPGDLKFDKLLARVPTTIYRALYEDETASSCTYLVPAAHSMESWGDARATDGSVTLMQPLIAPLWRGVTEIELLAAFVGQGDAGANRLLRESWQAKMSTVPGAIGEFDQIWEKWLGDGVIVGTETAPESALTLDTEAVTRDLGALLARAPKGPGFEIVFAPDYKVVDGRFANASWLQELPDPITKVTWDNAAYLSPATAKALGVVSKRDNDKFSMLSIVYRQNRITAPALIVPGHADDCITLTLGYGRQGSESVARGVGYNANTLRNSDAPWFDRGAEVTLATGMHLFGITQNHWSAEDREPAMEVTLQDFQNERSEFHERIEERRGVPATLHTPWDYSKEQYKWAMAIDLGKCTGCSACVVACQAENNVPVVGKDNVVVGREMQWIRIDRYFAGDLEDPEVVNQPLACVHCETAPCEYVCPVNATVHSDEGLNEMVYNRCIGTRYCSNNCPYKVRRFNFFDYTSETPAARRLGMNPDVTVRSRGVMEKCTYCVQRIERKRIETRIQGRAIQDGELKTACQQGCPSDAIVFGNLNDPGSRVSRLHADPRRYDLLHEIGTRPRTAYLARVRNPNPELAKG